MKNTTKFAILSVAVSVLYLVFYLVCSIVKLPSIYSSIPGTVYGALLVVFPLVLMAEAKSLKRPAVYIVVAFLLKFVNMWLGVYMTTVPKEKTMMVVSAMGFVYLFYLVFVCLGFFKLSKLLPKPSLVRGLSIAYPCSYFLQGLVNAMRASGLFSISLSQGLFVGIGYLQIAIIALLIYSLLKGIEREQI